MNPTLQGVKQRFGIIGNSQALNHAIQIAMRVAPTDLSVLINGESGVGKEAFSKILHQLSPRKHEKFIAVNCGAIPEGTIDSELFGHEKGAFTGAQDKRKGYFETVNGGTIFLDEIGEMPVGTQARLLRVLESGEFIKVGSSEVQKTNVRIVAATNRNLLKAAEQGKFREDLYYRLSTVPITIPALRDRGDDILLLFRKFATDFAERHRRRPIQLSEDAQSLLQRYPWPGNVRQLTNLAERAVLQARRGQGKIASLLMSDANEVTSVVTTEGKPLKEYVEAFEKMLIDNTMRRHKGSITKVMDELLLPRRTLNEKMAKYGLQRSDYLN